MAITTVDAWIGFAVAILGPTHPDPTPVAAMESGGRSYCDNALTQRSSHMDDSLIASVPDAAIPTGRPTIAVPRSPLHCDPNSHTDWRWRTAINLAWICTHPEPCPDDPWLKVAVEFWTITKRGWGNQKPTSLQRAIPDAYALHAHETLERDLVEARLLADESVEEIAQRTGTDVNVVSAYAMLFFDVSSLERRFAWSRAQMLGKERSFDNPLWAAPSRISLTSGVRRHWKWQSALCSGWMAQALSTGLPPKTVLARHQTSRTRLELADGIVAVYQGGARFGVTGSR